MPSQLQPTPLLFTLIHPHQRNEWTSPSPHPGHRTPPAQFRDSLMTHLPAKYMDKWITGTMYLMVEYIVRFVNLEHEAFIKGRFIFDHIKDVSGAGGGVRG